MTKKNLFAVFLLSCSFFTIVFSACSNDEEYDAQIVAASPLAQAIVQSMEQCSRSAEEQYVVYSPNGGIQIVGKPAFMLANMLEQAGASAEEMTFTFNSKDATVRSTRGDIQDPLAGKWIYAGRASSKKAKAMLFATKLATTLPPDREINIKIVPVYDDKNNIIGYDVFYQIV